MRCPRCAENGIDSILGWDGLVCASMPTSFRHDCRICGHVEYYDEIHYELHEIGGPFKFKKDDKFYKGIDIFEDEKQFKSISCSINPLITKYKELLVKLESIHSKLSELECLKIQTAQLHEQFRLIINDLEKL